MNGKIEYANNFERMINRIVEQQTTENRKVLNGYRNHIKDAMAISSVYSYVGCINRFMEYVKKSVKEIDYDDYVEFLGTLDGKSSTYKIATYAALRAFSEYLFASHKNDTDHMQYVKSPKVSKSGNEIKRDKRLKNVLHEEEIQCYLKAVDCGCGTKRAKASQENWKERDKCIIEVFLTTGMRCSALYKLDVSDIDMKQGTIKALEKRDKMRVFYMSNEVKECMQEWLGKRELLLNGKHEDSLFISNRRTRLDSSCIAKVTKKYGEGIKNTSPHKLRATFGTYLLDKTNGDLDKVRIAMGHSSVSTTELYMRRDTTKVGKEVAELMGDLF